MRELITIHPDGRTVREIHKRVSLEMLQARVGGYIERLASRYEGRPAEVWCNEEGLLQGLKRNNLAQNIFNRPVVGPVVVNRVLKI